MNTPDTEKEIEIELCKALEKQRLDIYAVASTLDIFRKAISSRDTYWKERVRWSWDIAEGTDEWCVQIWCGNTLLDSITKKSDDGGMVKLSDTLLDNLK